MRYGSRRGNRSLHHMISEQSFILARDVVLLHTGL